MSKKLKEFLYPDWRKMSIFFLVILFFSLLWIQVLANSLPIMIIATNEFQNTFCDIKSTAVNCSMPTSQIYAKEAELNQTVDNLNLKYARFINLKPNFDLARTFIPTGVVSCMLNQDTIALLNGYQPTQNVNILGMTPGCDNNSLLTFLLNLVILYLIICVVFWFYDKKR
jgi:hypothetical protein